MYKKDRLYPGIKVLLIFSLIGMMNCSRTFHKVNVESGYIQMDGEGQSDQKDIDSIISPYREKLAEEMNEVIGTFGNTMIKSRPESTLGNWMCDALQIKAGDIFNEEVDCTIHNYGGIRLSSIQEGPVTVGTIFELMPFDNFLVLLEMKGETLRQFCDHMAIGKGWPVSKELSYKIAHDKAVEITINEKELDDNRIYRICSTDYVANGGDNASFLKGLPIKISSVYVRDALIDYMKGLTQEGVAATSANDGRVTIKELMQE
jgi:2',3'-cyclic-nucleotide 2'-phosphodiesterase (5'-nucleotidase family)